MALYIGAYVIRLSLYSLSPRSVVVKVQPPRARRSTATAQFRNEHENERTRESMEVQQVPPESATHAAEAASPARGSKTDVDETPLDAVMLQPAAPTLGVALSAADTSMSPAAEADAATAPVASPGSASLQTHIRAESSPARDTSADIDFTALDSSVDARDSHWMDGADCDQRKCDESMEASSPVQSVSDGRSQRLQEGSDSAEGVEDLIALPSPVASGVSRGASFDVFATSPVKQMPRELSEADDAPLASSASTTSDQEAAVELAPAMSALSLGIDDATKDAEVSRDALTTQNTEHESEDQESYDSDWDADAADATGQTPDNVVEGLSIAAPPAASTAMAVTNDNEFNRPSSPGQQRHLESASPAASPVASTPASPLAIESIAESSGAEEAAEPSPAAAAAMQSGLPSDAQLPSFSFAPGASGVADESPVKARVSAANQVPSPEQQSADSPVKSQLQRSPARATARDARTSENDARPSSKEPLPSKASKALKTSASSETKDSSAPSKDAKPKNGRVAVTKPRASDSVKVKAPAVAPTRAAAVKPKAGSSVSSSGAAVTRAAPLSKTRVDASSGPQTRERGARGTNNKSPVPPAPGQPKRESSAASGKLKASSTAPPPAPTSLEQEGPKSVKKRLSSSELEAASNRLYSDALEAKKRKEVLKAELEESFTFTPQVNAAKRHVVPDEKNRFVLLHEKAMDAAKRKGELKQKRDKPECTFKPKITAKAKKLTTNSTKPRYENLYQQAHEIKQKREEKKNEIDQKAVDECSFKPKIKTMKSPTKSRPLYDAERLKQKKLALEQKKIEAELSECTFKPKVVANKTAKSKSDDAAAAKTAGGDSKLFDRLYQASQKRAENLEKLRLEREEQVKSVATFHPKITSSGATKSAAGASKQPFHERLYSKDHMQKVTADREQKKLEEVQKFSFKPHITAVPDEIKSKQSSASNSPDKSIFERLYDEKDRVKEKIELSEEIKKQKEMVGCTFHPQIETSPSHPAKDKPSVPIWERLLSYDKNQVLEEREKQRQELEMQECTFKPEVTPSEYFTPSKSPSAGIFDRLTTGGGAASMPSSDMKRRESERKGFGSVQHKRRSVPELGAFKEPVDANSVGATLTSSNIVMTPEPTSASASANQPRSAPASSSSLPYSESMTLERPKREDAASSPLNGEALVPAKTRGVESFVDDRTGPEDANGGFANNTDEYGMVNHGQSILENYDSWAINLEEKMRRLS